MKARRKVVLAPLIRRTRDDAFFVSHALTKYKSILGVDDSHLTHLLSCTAEGLERLALCRFPNDQEARFGADVRQIAAFVPCDADRLMQMFRQMAAFNSLQDSAQRAGQGGLLLAARDRKEGPRSERDGSRARKRTKK